MAGIITTGSHPKLLWPGVKAIWGQVYDEHQEEFPALFETDRSEKNYEEDVQVTGFGLAPVKPQGQGTAYDSELQGPIQRYTHVAYGLGYIVTYEELRDNLYMEVSRRRARALAMSFRQTKENVAANVYNLAFSGTQVLADGVSLINTAHPNTSGGTYSNQLATAANLSEAALEDMLIQIAGATSDRGLLINLQSQSLHIPRQLFFTANRIVKSVFQTGTANNDVNVVSAINAFPKGIHMNHYFSSSTAWFIRTNCPNGMKHYIREEVDFDQDNDFDTKNAKAKGYERYSFGATDPRGVFGSQGS
jgi:hypothetical protein